MMEELLKENIKRLEGFKKFIEMEYKIEVDIPLTQKEYKKFVDLVEPKLRERAQELGISYEGSRYCGEDGAYYRYTVGRL